MKKAKIMLLTIAVFATVGAALAFKAKKFTAITYCFVEAVQEPAPEACKNILEDAVATPFVSGTPVYYTTTTNLNGCGFLRCSSTADDINEE